eukprot:1626365-Rhodomonas_salina.4
MGWLAAGRRTAAPLRSWRQEEAEGGQQGVYPGSRPSPRRGRELSPSCRTCREPGTGPEHAAPPQCAFLGES